MNYLYVVVHRLFLPACLAITLSSRPYRGMVSISQECSPLLVGMLNSAVIVMACHYTVFVQYTISLLGQCFVVILKLPELDKIHIIKELLCVKYRLISLPLFDVSHSDYSASA